MTIFFELQFILYCFIVELFICLKLNSIHWLHDLLWLSRDHILFKSEVSSKFWKCQGIEESIVCLLIGLDRRLTLGVQKILSNSKPKAHWGRMRMSKNGGMLGAPSPWAIHVIKVTIPRGHWDQPKMSKNGKKLGAPFAWNIPTMLFSYNVLPLAKAAGLTCAILAIATQTASTNSASLMCHLHPWKFCKRFLLFPIEQGKNCNCLGKVGMNSKLRSCSLESCDFIGNYSELRKHARSDHPYIQPSKVDPNGNMTGPTLSMKEMLGTWLLRSP